MARTSHEVRVHKNLGYMLHAGCCRIAAAIYAFDHWTCKPTIHGDGVAGEA